MVDYDFDAAELADMRTAQTGHMQDTCLIRTYSETFNTFSEPVASYAEGAAMDCGLDMRPGSERHGQDHTSTEYDATLRLAITAAPSVRDQIKVTHRFGEALASALTFEIVAPIQRGPSGIRLLLRKVSV